MDPVTAAIVRVTHEIPFDILKLAFMAKRYDPTRQDRFYDNVAGTSIDEQIRLQVVEGRVAIDVNLVGGTEVLLPMWMADREYIDGWNMLYRFSREATGGRRITTVHEMTYGFTQGLGVGNTPGYDNRTSTYMSTARNILRATEGVGSMSSAYVQLVGINTVLVNDINQVIGDSLLRCRLTHEPNFNDIQPYYYHAFGEMVSLAVKAYIYNKLIIEIDESQIRGGASIGRIREVIDGYADANQMYMEYVTIKWAKIRNMSDTQTWRRILKNNLGGKPHR